MSEAEFNYNQQRAYRKKPDKRPPGISDEDWKRQIYVTQNRMQVAAKLSRPNWMAFRAWLIKEELSMNSGINRLVATHPETSPLIIKNLEKNPHHYD